MQSYRYLKTRGALNEATGPPLATRPLPQVVPGHILALLPAQVVRTELVLPLKLEGETLTVAAVDAGDVGLRDKLSFIINKKIVLVPADRAALEAAIKRYYPSRQTESVDSMLQEFTDTAIDFAPTAALARTPTAIDLDAPVSLTRRGSAGKRALAREEAESESELCLEESVDTFEGSGMFFYVVEEGQRAMMRRSDGTMEIVVGPRRLWRPGRRFAPLAHHVAHPGEFLLVRYRDGRQEHLPGPAELWVDPRVHQSVQVQEALQLAAKEAVVVYSKGAGDAVARRIVHGPGLFMPQPGEWLHTFSWHASKGGHQGVQKVPNSLVFQKLWLMPDQMYHDVSDVRTADDAVLTIRLMLFFELLDIEKMLDTTHDPIGDFVNAATSDVVDFTGKFDFETFKRTTTRLNELETYAQLTSRATQCGYRINKVVYRGYGAPEALQQMHDKAIEARTKLQLDRATEQQAQDLEDYRLDSQIARAIKRRGEQSTEVEHDLELARRRQEAELQQHEALAVQQRQQRRFDMQQQLELGQEQQSHQRAHLAALRDMGVDLTAYLTQARADKVIEVRGSPQGMHVHLEPAGLEQGNGKEG
jgi:hypothetical protein